MLVLRALLLMAGLALVLVGPGLAWGWTSVGAANLDIDPGQYSQVAAILVGAIALLGLSDAMARRPTGVLLVILGALVLVSAVGLTAMLAERLGSETLAVSLLGDDARPVLGPAGVVTAIGGALVVLAGTSFMATTLPTTPPLTWGNGSGAVPAGWYRIGRGHDRIAYWTGSRWTHSRLLTADAARPAPVVSDYVRRSKRCPRCAEDVRMEALVCRYCGHSFEPAAHATLE